MKDRILNHLQIIFLFPSLASLTLLLYISTLLDLFDVFYHCLATSGKITIRLIHDYLDKKLKQNLKIH